MQILKSNIKYLLLLLAVLNFSCRKDFLDKQPDDMLTLDQVFNNRLEAERYLRNVYSFLPNEMAPWTNFSGISDEGDILFVNMEHNDINNGNWSPDRIPFNDFGGLYRGIRSASVFLTRIGECNECEQLIPGSKKQWAAEAKALRAWYYFLLMRKFGPVALVKDILPVDVELGATQLPRSSFDECVAYIMEELDGAQAALPQKVADTRELGRVDGRVVQAMKSRILLYAASPLWNGNTDYAAFKNSDGKQLVNTTYDADRWKKAADAAKLLIDMMPEGLYKKNTNGVFDPLASYRDVFIDRFNQEIIWARPSSDWWSWQKHAAPRQFRGYNGMAATQQQVDAYYMANGLQINEPGSGYVEAGFSTTDGKYTKAGAWNMYVGREPRFYATITYNGGYWPSNSTQGSGDRLQFYFTGSSGKGGSHDYSPTGYLISKFTSPSSNPRTDQFVMKTWNYFRLAEIYLNYVEALNEYSPGHGDIKRYLDLIHERAGIPAIPAGLGQAEMRERIRLERRIELAFEGHRVFDNRRWKIAEQTDGGPMWGMNVNKGNSFTDVSFFERTVFETRVFQRKHYLWPIPQSEMDRNKAMVQNPGW
ncbi:RagB/SusD family nutrient uptake outer membrane protein [Paracnuella aquatica]|uniref:RagB/SusD family nutrient uptake outer membrane protein n=1 Tax=Paracnuella aquatica TaxID=2268757 RepID=UPI000DEFBE8A|nr:RagB/SusD family nutrient uptake outer membrane protein [Paracnuella aquatica]RPD50718.1 RagB/SusD family nutrient uptake outer membrane protein [Paracnuella aquatica]